ncbi:MAG: hypothetical protein Q8Q31_04090 [Nanoarchaeota archaeon]|nr:hypothetical protein [Nanoarchaeota archaeon]
MENAILELTEVLEEEKKESEPLSEDENLELLSKKLKRNMLQTISAAKTGHIGACCSSNELMAALYFSPELLKFDIDNPNHPERDYVLVRGHLGPLRYNLFSLLDWLKPEEMNRYRKLGSRLCGHEDMTKTPGVDITPSGSLGMLLSYAVGARYSLRKRGLENRLFCFLGDGEEQEGNISEAARHASNIRINNLITIIDKNEKQLSTSTKCTDGQSDLAQIWKGYGWEVLELQEGHNLKKIRETYNQAIEEARLGPVCIIANTQKSQGIPGAEEHYSGFHVYHNNEEDHGKNEVDLETPIRLLSKEIEGKNIQVPRKKLPYLFSNLSKFLPLSNMSPDPSEKEESSFDFLAEFLSKLSKYGKERNIYILTADYPPRALMYSTGQFSIPNLHYENVGIREQHLMAMIQGIKTVEKDSEVIALCGDAFMYRWADQLNALAQANTKVILYAMQAGVSGAKNGSTHQSSGQPGLALTMPGVNFFEPASKLDWFYAMNKAIHTQGPSYIRTHSGKVPYDFGDFNNLPYYAIKPKNLNPDGTIITSGIITREAVNAAQVLKEQDIHINVINVIEPKNLTDISSLIQPNSPLYILYNGNPEVLSYPIYKDLVRSKKQPSKIYERGFSLGETGSTSDLLTHLSLDSRGICSLIRQDS